MNSEPSQPINFTSQAEFDLLPTLQFSQSLSGVVETSYSLMNSPQGHSNICLLNKKRKSSLHEFSKNSKHSQESPVDKTITQFFKQKKNLNQVELLKHNDLSKEILSKEQKNDFLEEIINKTNKINQNGHNKLSNKTIDIISKLATKPTSNFEIKLCDSTLNVIQSVKKRMVEGKKANKFDDDKDVLKGPSLRDKYEELLTRELLLPFKYKDCLYKMILLDEAIDHLKNSRKYRTITSIQQYIKSTHKKEFKLEDFQRILFVGPHLYIYKWEKLQNDHELIIDIPSNISQRLNSVYDSNTNFQSLQTTQHISLEHSLSHELKEKREGIFKECLINLTLDHHTRFLKERKINTKLNPIKHKTWHHEFDVHNCPEISRFPLQQKPKKIAKIF
jgi:hypothetical protein